MDLVGFDPNRIVKIVDAKTGKPNPRDRTQFRIYLHALPLVRPEFAGHQLMGELVYRDGIRKVVRPIPGFTEMLEHFADILGGAVAPPRVPSTQDCRFCPARQVCPDRIVPDLDDVPF
jgi:hypothetical protein